MRTIKHIHPAKYCPIEDLITYSPLPSNSLDQIDPFLVLNHHGPQRFIPENNGLPFGPHPHRGIETVTFILSGELAHTDSGGHESVIRAGGVQWMTAGRGLIHSELSSEEFKEKGGDLEILQLWINLPAKLKMAPPTYNSLHQDQIPSLILNDNKVKIKLISGNWDHQKGAVETLTNILISIIDFETDGQLKVSVPKEHSIFFYVVRGSLEVNEKTINKLNLVEFNFDHEIVYIKATKDSVLLFGHARPLNEPFVMGGPFVMNTEKEIEQAYQDFYKGKMGKWE